MQRQSIKSWITERVWINPYWHKISQHPGRIFLEQDLFENIDSFTSVRAKYDFLICEFGSGSGEHLIQLAKLNPRAAVIGFELRFKRVVKTIEKAKKLSLDNVFVICGYAQNVTKLIPENLVREIYINFPDPWEKKVKNRLINNTFIEDLSKIQNSRGKISFKTDHYEYFQSVFHLFQVSDLYEIVFSTDDLHRDVSKEKIILTEFERLFLSQKLPIYSLTCHKLS